MVADAGVFSATMTDVQISTIDKEDQVDYQFISDLEGGSKTKGYVPAVSVSKSGVTIATGFDLGQRSESDLKSLNLAPLLINKLKPYLGKTKMEAKSLLKKLPLVITSSEAQVIDKAVKSNHISQIKSKYDSSTKNNVKFVDLSHQAQTMIASVSFQYGSNLSARTPKFWKAVTSQDLECQHYFVPRLFSI